MRRIATLANPSGSRAASSLKASAALIDPTFDAKAGGKEGH
jgi:hypothetical protein